jgi:hypothetical protein
VGGGKIKGAGEGGRIWFMCFVYMYENTAMKPVEMFPIDGGGRVRENDVGLNLAKVHWKHIVNVSPLYN